MGEGRRARTEIHASREGRPLRPVARNSGGVSAQASGSGRRSASSSQDLNEAEVEQEEDEQRLGGPFDANDVETDHRFEDRHLDYSQTGDKKDLASLHPSALQSKDSRNRIRAESGQPLTPPTRYQGVS